MNTTLKSTLKAAAISILMTALVPAVSSAKVDGFNAMITENGKAQEHLRQELHGHVESARQAQNSAHATIETNNDFLMTVNTPTDKGFMTFKKELVQYRPSEEKQMQRLANEIKSLDTQF